MSKTEKNKILCDICYNKKLSEDNMSKRYNSDINTNMIKIYDFIDKWVSRLIKYKIIKDNRGECDNMHCGIKFPYSKSFFLEYCLWCLYFSRYIKDWNMYGELSKLIKNLNNSYDNYYKDHKKKSITAIRAYAILNFIKKINNKKK